MACDLDHNQLALRTVIANNFTRVYGPNKIPRKLQPLNV